MDDTQHVEMAQKEFRALDIALVFVRRGFSQSFVSSFWCGQSRSDPDLSGAFTACSFDRKNGQWDSSWAKFSSATVRLKEVVNSSRKNIVEKARDHARLPLAASREIKLLCPSIGP